MKQNIYDNEEFFNSYKSLRDSDDNYNVLLEQPAMKKLLPNLKNKRVLDLGCGFGINCMDFVKAGADYVMGIDISTKMLAVAKKDNYCDKIDYLNIPLENLDTVNGKFDLIYSSLSFNYIKDFNKLVSDIYSHLNAGGQLLFSQEHPIVTASAGIANKYIIDDNGNKVFCFCNYQNEEIRRVEKWFVEGVIKYHRTLSTVINTLCDNGFMIEKVVEPVPDDYALSIREGLKKEFIKPTFLIVKAKMI